jgi:hypothetical protein
LLAWRKLQKCVSRKHKYASNTRLNFNQSFDKTKGAR